MNVNRIITSFQTTGRISHEKRHLQGLMASSHIDRLVRARKTCTQPVVAVTIELVLAVQ